jgi:hypothetical protein
MILDGNDFEETERRHTHEFPHGLLVERRVIW